jgi:anti-anti-sigma factor
MGITQKKEMGFVIRTLKGRSNGLSVHNVEKIIGAALKGNTSNLLIDLGALVYMSSVDLRVILYAIKVAKRRGRAVVLCCLTGHVIEVLKDIFEVIGIRSFIAIADSVEAGQKILISKQERRWFRKTGMDCSDPTNTEIVNNEIHTEVTL